MSLANLSEWCQNRFGPTPVTAELESRQFDIPWLVLDCTKAANLLGWTPKLTKHQILDEIANFALNNPEWLAMTSPD
jgi:CDP-paratose 2-epimerase